MAIIVDDDDATVVSSEPANGMVSIAHVSAVVSVHTAATARAPMTAISFPSGDAAAILKLSVNGMAFTCQLVKLVVTAY